MFKCWLHDLVLGARPPQLLPATVGAPFCTIKIYRESSRCIMVESHKKHGIFMGDTGGACRFDSTFHPATCISKGKCGEKRSTKFHFADCDIHLKKKDGKKKIQNTFLEG